MTKTKTVELRRGYIDHDGNAHKTAVLRLPTIDDEIQAECVIARMAAEKGDNSVMHSQTLDRTAMLAECTVQLGGILDPKLDHLRALRRYDLRALSGALEELEREDEAEQLDEGKSQTAP